MEEKELKTSPKQRIFIILIAVIMLGSIIASYAAIIINGNNAKSSSADSGIDQAKIAEYEDTYEEKLAVFKEASKSDYDTFIKYKSEVIAYNENTANQNGIQTRDLLKGAGRKLEEGDSNYLAYYIGFCADESVFDSSLDNPASPTSFAKILDASMGMIEGWNLGVEGMRIGGVREITIPGELAYGEQMEICGGYSKPLKFIVMPVAKEEPMATIASELDTAYMKLQYAYYGIDYDAQM